MIDAAFEQMEFLPEETVFQEGRPGDRFFLVQEGRVVLAKRSSKESLEVGQAGPGEYFGEMALFDECPRSAEATAVEDTVLLSLDRDRMRSLVQQSPEVAWAFCRELSMRMREANERLRGLNLRLATSGRSTTDTVSTRDTART